MTSYIAICGGVSQCMDRETLLERLTLKAQIHIWIWTEPSAPLCIHLDCALVNFLKLANAIQKLKLETMEEPFDEFVRSYKHLYNKRNSPSFPVDISVDQWECHKFSL